MSKCNGQKRKSGYLIFFQVHASTEVVEFYCGYQLYPIRFPNKQKSDIEGTVCLCWYFLLALLEEKVNFVKVDQL